jgi:hypothetical protein
MKSSALSLSLVNWHGLGESSILIRSKPLCRHWQAISDCAAAICAFYGETEALGNDADVRSISLPEASKIAGLLSC